MYIYIYIYFCIKRRVGLTEPTLPRGSGLYCTGANGDWSHFIIGFFKDPGEAGREGRVHAL